MKRFAALASVSVTLSLLMAGCPQTGANNGDDNNNNNNNGASATDLSTSEEDAISAALTSTESLANATGAVQSPTAAESDDVSLDLPEQGSGAEVEFGTCPSVALAASGQAQAGDAALDLTIDFGDGCLPFDDGQYECSGLVTGSFSQAQQAIDCSFDSLTCNGNSLNGEAALSYEFTPSNVGLTGDWNLSWDESGDTFVTDGFGAVDYDREAQSTTIASFSGALTTPTNDQYDTTLTDVQTSFMTHGNFVPFGGTITLDGDDIREITIEFNSDSPSTGIVEVTIGSGAAFEVNIFEL